MWTPWYPPKNKRCQTEGKKNSRRKASSQNKPKSHDSWYLEFLWLFIIPHLPQTRSHPPLWIVWVHIWATVTLLWVHSLFLFGDEGCCCGDGWVTKVHHGWLCLIDGSEGKQNTALYCWIQRDTHSPSAVSPLALLPLELPPPPPSIPFPFSLSLSLLLSSQFSSPPGSTLPPPPPAALSSSSSSPRFL